MVIPRFKLDAAFLSSRVRDVQEVTLRTFRDERGTLSLLDDIRAETGIATNRCFFLSDVSFGKTRGDHANTRTDEVLISVSGRFDLIVDDSEDCRQFRLEKLKTAVTVPRGLWLSLSNFSSDAVCAVLASGTYRENRRIGNRDLFATLKSTRGN